VSSISSSSSSGTGFGGVDGDGGDTCAGREGAMVLDNGLVASCCGGRLRGDVVETGAGVDFAPSVNFDRRLMYSTVNGQALFDR
jgi:hypothetical protein